ncbi:endonuclease/exonuclease/phosphatase family protein [Acetobacter vaccinii]|uniref:endonuclease/exonuclease/phosphatase family protein n=1 Tax=Acetobacter vaccinii TaxID=2592655 RepID=UPI001FEEB327|nr:endonuclease/exonuclease/phosphatase family protein [Acetobacter vaccinii]
MALIFFLPTASTSAASTPLRLSTWNVEWLLDETSPTTSTAPADRPYRGPQDYAAMAEYAARLKADVIGMQEVDSPATLGRLFPPSRYQLLFSDDSILQRTALVVRKGLALRRNPDITALNTNPPGAVHALRSGLDVSLFVNGTELRLLIVHLKTGCWDNPPAERHHACPTLLQQFDVLKRWISARAAEGSAFAIMGDFNRRMTPQDPLFLTLTQAAPLDLTTAHTASPCQGGGYFIDHILLGGAAMGWKEAGSLHVMLIPQGESPVLSDHCPVSITLNIPTKTP